MNRETILFRKKKNYSCLQNYVYLTLSEAPKKVFVFVKKILKFSLYLSLTAFSR